MLFQIRDNFIEEKNLFKVLNTLIIDGFEPEVKFSLIQEHKEQKPINFGVLSEGEQQSIIIRGLIELVGNENTLFLFDEPDSYLHPQKQRELIDQIEEVNLHSNHHFFIATHSPFVVQSVKINQVIHFDKGKVNYFENEILDYKAIINSLFGVNGRFNTDIEVKINEFNKYRETILKDKEFNIENFKALVNEIIGFGEETRVLISRELAQLKRLKNFSIDE